MSLHLIKSWQFSKNDRNVSPIVAINKEGRGLCGVYLICLVGKSCFFILDTMWQIWSIYISFSIFSNVQSFGKLKSYIYGHGGIILFLFILFLSDSKSYFYTIIQRTTKLLNRAEEWHYPPSSTIIPTLCSPTSEPGKNSVYVWNSISVLGTPSVWLIL